MNRTMARREFLGVRGGSAALLAVPWRTALAGSSGGERPNRVLFLSDDHGVLDCGPYGAREVRTPALEVLARESLRFDQAFAAGGGKRFVSQVNGQWVCLSGN